VHLLCMLGEAASTRSRMPRAAAVRLLAAGTDAHARVAHRRARNAARNRERPAALITIYAEFSIC
jgi:hypothetical protein